MSMTQNLLDDKHPFIIGEVSQNHDGSLGTAHAYLDALADAGVDVVKFQTHIADAESTIDDTFRIKFSYQDATRFDYWQRMEFTESQWVELKRHADERGIGFLSTPFSVAAVELLDRIGVEVWKLGSGDVDPASSIMGAILATGKPLIVSSGMSGWSDLDAMVARMTDASAQFALMQCTTKYPTPLTDIGLNAMPEMRERYGCRVGLSDHSGVTAPVLAAIARGFPLIETHVTFDRRMFGPDVVASLTVDEMKAVAAFARDVRLMDANPVDKDAMAAELDTVKTLFGRSLALKHDRQRGHVLNETDLLMKKPGTGLQWSDVEHLLGRPLKHDLSRNRLLKIEDIA